MALHCVECRFLVAHISVSCVDVEGRYGAEGGQAGFGALAVAMKARDATLKRCIATLDRANETLSRANATLNRSNAPLYRCNGAMGRYLATRFGAIASFHLTRSCQER